MTAMTPMTPAEFVATLGPVAQQCCEQTGIPASVTLAQAIDESGWGRSQLATISKNLFGIKADPRWQGPSMAMPTHEYFNGKYVLVPARWRVYATWAGSMLDHAKFFFDNPRYRPALAVVDQPANFAAALQHCGYSTDPLYAHKLMQIVAFRNLTQFDVPREKWNLVDWARYP